MEDGRSAVSEWLGVNEVVVTTVVGLLCLLLGIGISGWRSAVRRKQLLDAHETQLQPLQQALAETRRQAESVQLSLTAAEARLTQQARALADQEEQLRSSQEVLAHAIDAQTQLPLRTEELQTANEALQSVQAQNRHLQSQLREAESRLRAKESSLAQTVQEMTALHDQISELTVESSSQRENLSAIQVAYDQEVARRQHITNEIATLYHHLHDSTNSSLPSASPNGNLDAIQEEQNNSQVQPGEPQPDPAQLAQVQSDQVQADAASLPAPVIGPMVLLPTGTFAEDGISSAAGTEAETMPVGINQTHQENKIEQFLISRGITIKHIPSEAEIDPILNSLASYLGTHYETVKPLYQQIKRNMQMGDDFTIILKDEPSDAISRICQFGKKLYDVAFLEQYRYIRSPHYLLKAKTTRLPTAQNFFSGQWLERYVVQQVQAAINILRAQMDQPVEFDYISNPQVLLPNAQDGELDLIFYVNDAMYWIETKSGDYQQHISKYSTIAKTLNLDAKHALMVLTDIPASRSTELTALFRMGVCSLNEFENELMTTLQKELL